MNHTTEMNDKLERMWSEIMRNSPLFQAIESGDIDKKLYAVYMFETYHYTMHNARNQALVGVRAFDVAPRYTKFCFEHAAEETGHELMALHDVKSLGLRDETFVIPPPLPATEVLIAYLYWISATGNPLQRLGYSYWAENVYTYIMPSVKRLQSLLGLEDHQLTFFIAHSDIDEAHAREVQEVMERHCTSAEDYAAVDRVMVQSLNLTARMLDDVFEAYQKLIQGEPSPYSFLNDYL